MPNDVHEHNPQQSTKLVYGINTIRWNYREKLLFNEDNFSRSCNSRMSDAQDIAIYMPRP